MNTIQLADCVLHVSKLLSDNRVSYTIVADFDEAYYDSNTRVIAIPVVVDLDTYLTCLHEISHFMLKHCKPSSWDEEVLCEIEAWNKTYEMSKVEVSQNYKNYIDSIRIKASWE